MERKKSAIFGAKFPQISALRFATWHLSTLETPA